MKLTIEELNKLNTKRLLAYFKKQRSLIMQDNRGLCSAHDRGLLSNEKFDELWNANIKELNIMRDILNTREHIDRKRK